MHSLCFFWDVRPDLIQRARAAGCKVLYQVGRLADAIAAATAGADVIICQGVEAGGHVQGDVSSLVLLPRVRARRRGAGVSASGGFATGGGLVRRLRGSAPRASIAARRSWRRRSPSPTSSTKRRIVEATSEQTVSFRCVRHQLAARARPCGRCTNSVTEAYRDDLWGHAPDDFPREVIGHEEQRPIYKFSTDSPLRNMTGDFEAMAPFAGQVCGLIEDICPAGERLRRIGLGGRDHPGAVRPDLIVPA